MFEAMSDFIEKHKSMGPQEIQGLRDQVEQLTQRVGTHDHSMAAAGHAQGLMDHLLDLHTDWIEQLDARVADLEVPRVGAAIAPVQPAEDLQEEDEGVDEVLDP
jgi:hypothetical protein